MYYYSRWILPNPLGNTTGQTREALRLLPSYAPPPVPVHHIEWTRKRRLSLGAQVSAAWEAVVSTMPIDNLFSFYAPKPRRRQ